MSSKALGPQFDDQLPPAPGSQPIPEGHVRLFHYTDPENVASITQHGLTRSHARGESYGEPSVVWAAAHRESPSEDRLRNRPHVEFHADPSRGQELDIGEHYGQGGDVHAHIEHMYGTRSHVTMKGDVSPERILAIHQPWHSTVRYLESDPQTLHDYTEGDFKDDTTGDPHTDEALTYVRAKHARGGYK